MSNEANNILSSLLAELGNFLTPICEVSDDPRQLVNLLARLGWYLKGLRTADLSKLIQTVDKIQVLIDTAQKTKLESLDDIGKALTAIAGAIEGTMELSSSLDQLSGVGLEEETLKALGSDLVNYLVVEYVYRSWPWLLQVLKLLTLVVDERPQPLFVQSGGSSNLVRYPVVRPQVKPEHLVALVSDPVAHLKKQYLANGLGTEKDAQEAALRIFGELRALVTLLGGHGVIWPAKEIEAVADPDNPDLTRSFGLIFRYFNLDEAEPTNSESLTIARCGAFLTLVSADGKDSKGNPGPGLEVAPFGLVNVKHSLGGWSLELTVDAATAGMFVGPNNVHLHEAGTWKLQVKLARGSSDGQALLAGASSGTHLEIGQLGLTAGAEIQEGRQQYDILLNAETGAFVLAAGDGDGFLQKVLPKDGLRVDFDLAIGWSNTRGLYFRGGAGLEVTVPIHKDLFGVLKVEAIYLALGAKETHIEVTAATTATLTLGPLSASVERVGASVVLTFPERGGNLGPVDAQFKFKPPNGLGLAIDASVVVGGGYLFFDPDNAKYAGVLQLEVMETISIKAIGLLTTRMPDGSDGFSLLIIICAEFPPIQLGFGFTLNGVGGLLGVNRTMVLDALRSGFKNRTLDSILFPPDPVANAPKIISDLSTIYPPAAGRYVFGPMVMLGWGTPEPLLKVELGIVLEIPPPVRLAILGKITVALPNEKAALVLLHLDILGAIDFERGDASIDASLYDSRVVLFTITGDMAMRLSWGEHSQFLVSVGGFHPCFTPPPKFPSLERLAISLAAGDNPRLRLEAYFAVTSNTVQFGARLEVYAGVGLGIFGTLSAQAHFSLDALVQFSPFWFQVDVEASASICHNGDVLFGVYLAFSLSGPEPWHAWGEATVEFLGKHTIRFDTTIAGDQPPPPPLPPVDPLPDLVLALSDPRNWSAQLPGEGNMVVSLREIAPGSQDVLAHPFGRLTFLQKVLPLEVPIQKLGAARLGAATTYEILQIDLGTQSVGWEKVSDAFAPGQFFDISEDEKLSRPSFESFTSGGTNIGSMDITFDSKRQTRAEFRGEFGYETVIIDAKDQRSMPPVSIRSKFPSKRPSSLYTPSQEVLKPGGRGAPQRVAVSDLYTPRGEVLEALAERGAAGRAPMAATGKRRFRGPKIPLAVNEAAYTVVRKTDLAPAPDTGPQTYTQAKIWRQGLQEQGATGYQIVRSHELIP